MTSYTKIDARLWNKARFARLSTRAKLAYFELLSNPALAAVRNRSDQDMRDLIEALQCLVGGEA